VTSQAGAGLLWDTAALVDDRPALLGQLIEKGALNLGVLAHRA
jgi:hypothetical protein